MATSSATYPSFLPYTLNSKQSWLRFALFYVPDTQLEVHNSHTRLPTGSHQVPHLTQGLPKVLAEADVGELQHLAPFLALAFPVSSTTCRAHKISTMSQEAKVSDCSLVLPGAEEGASLSPGMENKTEVVPPPPGGTKVLEPRLPKETGRPTSGC